MEERARPGFPAVLGACIRPHGSESDKILWEKKLLSEKKQGPTRIRTGDDGFANRCLSQLGDRARKVSGELVVSWRKENINNW